ncbi:MAG: ABC transporter substrate-binding protein [Chloroflexi bacterium]|nr:ABC transporter substrate-binding protein [Chloroflexota bacterium]
MKSPKIVLFVLVVLLTLGIAWSGLAQDMSYNEAPILAERVAAGDLPPVEERLPVNPDVSTPIDQVGTYGGSLQLLADLPTSWGDAANIIRAFLIERDHRTGDELQPGLAESWALSDDGMEFTLTLREGLKWSDGAPFTTDDLVFMWEDLYMNAEVTPGGPPGFFQPGGEPMQVEKVDDLTIKYTFSVPYYVAPYYFTHWGDWYGSQQCCFQAKHVLSTYHINYNEDADALAQEAGFEHWYELLQTKLVSNGVHDPEVPGMGPWVPVEVTTDGIRLERNPYYYRVDTEGNQLPYIDSVRATYRASNEERILSIIAGDVDFRVSALSPADYPVLQENEANGGYTTYLLNPEMPAAIDIHVNLTYTPLEGEDPVLADLFREAGFRQALSLALNREEINELVFLGTAEPVQLTVNRDSTIYKEEWAQSFAQYDPDAANALLDELGLARGSNGMRTRPDGSPLELIFQVPQQLAPNVQASELIVKYWQDVGLDVNLQIQDIGLVVNGLIDASYQISSFLYELGGDLNLAMNGSDVWNSFASVRRWQEWNGSGGEAGVEPPEEWIAMFELLNRRANVPMEQVLEDAAVLLQYQADNIVTIGVVGYAQAPAIIKNGLMNTDPSFGDIWIWDRIGGHRAYQWYWQP